MNTVAAIWFDRRAGIDRYRKLAAVWQLSAQRTFNSSTLVICEASDPPDFTVPCSVIDRSGRKIGPSKTLSWLKKLRFWHDIVMNSEGPTLVCDIDMMFFGDPFPELSLITYDVALCQSNTGAVYFSGSDKSKLFMENWLKVAERMVDDAALYHHWDAKYKGLDQAAMGLMRETMIGTDATVVRIPRKFHAVWKSLRFTKNPYMIHYHSRLRAAIFRPEYEVPDYVEPARYAWLQALEVTERATDK